MINQALNDPQTMTSDATIVAVLQLLNGAIFSADPISLSIHEKGLKKMINLRGGLKQLGGQCTIASSLTV